MRGKYRELYEEAFFQLVEEFDECHRRDSKIKTIKVDYEMALRKALSTVFPTACISGCYVHFMAAVNRQWQAKHPKELTQGQVIRLA